MAVDACSYISLWIMEWKIYNGWVLRSMGSTQPDRPICPAGRRPSMGEICCYNGPVIGTIP